MQFQEFPKMARLTRECVITEKIDGTNGQIVITLPTAFVDPAHVLAQHPDTRMVMLAGSRSKYLTVGRDGVKGGDNFGFAAWVRDNADALWTLGEGRHFGEWWGSGIQRTYGLSEKRFSLFNVSRWADARPACCGVVPTLYRGLFDVDAVECALADLRLSGSAAAPGFMKPEGVVVYHVAAGIGFKKTLDKDEQPKGRAA